MGSGGQEVGQLDPLAFIEVVHLTGIGRKETLLKGDLFLLRLGFGVLSVLGVLRAVGALKGGVVLGGRCVF
jgi:hypothetical protein